MTGKEFLNSLAKGKTDILQQLLGILTETGSNYCLIGGLAVNAYVEPVVSLDVDIVVAADNIIAVANTARSQNMKVEAFPHSVNISGSEFGPSDSGSDRPSISGLHHECRYERDPRIRNEGRIAGQCVTRQGVGLHG